MLGRYRYTFLLNNTEADEIVSLIEEKGQYVYTFSEFYV